MSESMVEKEKKIKQLIVACNATGNYKRMAEVAALEIRNALDEIGIRLGVRGISRGEEMHRYMNMVNEIFTKNLGVSIFQKSLLQKIASFQALFVRRKGDLPKQRVKEAWSLYFDLEQVLKEDFNFYGTMHQGSFATSYGFGRLPYFFSNLHGKEKDESYLNELLAQKIEKKEYIQQQLLKTRFAKEPLEKLIYLKRSKAALTGKNTDKVRYSGRLKDNINYRQEIEESLKYILFAGIIMLGAILAPMMMQTMFVPETMGGLWSLILIAVSGCGLLILTYYNYFYNR